MTIDHNDITGQSTAIDSDMQNNDVPSINTDNNTHRPDEWNSVKNCIDMVGPGVSSTSFHTSCTGGNEILSNECDGTSGNTMFNNAENQIISQSKQCNPNNSHTEIKMLASKSKGRPKGSKNSVIGLHLKIALENVPKKRQKMCEFES